MFLQIERRILNLSHKCCPHAIEHTKIIFNFLVSVAEIIQAAWSDNSIELDRIIFLDKNLELQATVFSLLFTSKRHSCSKFIQFIPLRSGWGSFEFQKSTIHARKREKTNETKTDYRWSESEKEKKIIIFCFALSNMHVKHSVAVHSTSSSANVIKNSMPINTRKREV